MGFFSKVKASLGLGSSNEELNESLTKTRKGFVEKVLMFSPVKKLMKSFTKN